VAAVSTSAAAGRTYRLGFLIPSGRKSPWVLAFLDELHLNGFNRRRKPHDHSGQSRARCHCVRPPIDHSGKIRPNGSPWRGGDSVGWANLADYLERIIDLDGLVAPVHHTSCIAHGGARAPSSAPAVARKEARSASLTGARQRRLCPLLRMITREYPKRFVDLGRCVRQTSISARSDVLASVATSSQVSFRFQESFGLHQAPGASQLKR
jgi:hypothetical protein